MRARSGTNLQDFPTKLPPYLRHSFLLSCVQSRAVRLIALDWRETPKKEKLAKFEVIAVCRVRKSSTPNQAELAFVRCSTGRKGNFLSKPPNFIL